MYKNNQETIIWAEFTRSASLLLRNSIVMILEHEQVTLHPGIWFFFFKSYSGFSRNMVARPMLRCCYRCLCLLMCKQWVKSVTHKMPLFSWLNTT